MRYQLINPVDESMSALEQVLFNRGINPNEIEHFKYPSQKDIVDPLKLENMTETELTFSKLYVIISVLKFAEQCLKGF